jgi:hypothetical protein
MMLVAALGRLVPHPPNFAPVAAVALFGAAYLPRKWAALIVPVVVMFVSDVLLEAISRLGVYGGWMSRTYGFHQGMLVIYGVMMLIAALGFLLREKRSVPRIGLTVLAGSVVFFVVTNFAVWLSGEVPYPKTPAGLAECYVKAIPFFHWTLLGDLFFATVLFGAFAIAERRYPILRPAAVPGAA